MNSSETGMVKWYDKKKGFGFIKTDEGKEDLFFHKTALDEVKFSGTLSPGQHVSFCRIVRPGGKLAAIDVTILPDSSSLTQHQPILRGRVVRFDTIKGFGFIQRSDDMGKDIFLHRKSLPNQTIDLHHILNQEVQFQIGPGNKPGTVQAVKVWFS